MRDKVKALIVPVPDLSGTERLESGEAMRCPSCAIARYPGEGFAADRGFGRDPPPPRLPVLQFPLHHLRARAVARADRDQAQRPPRAVRPRQAAALGVRSRCASARSSPSGSSRSVSKIVRELESLRRKRGLLRDHRRDGDGASARARRRRLCALRLGLPQFPRGEGLRAGARRTVRRGRAKPVAGQTAVTARK